MFEYLSKGVKHCKSIWRGIGVSETDCMDKCWDYKASVEVIIDEGIWKVVGFLVLL